MRTSRRAATLLLSAVLVLPVCGGAEEGRKSAEDIVNGLLGGEQEGERGVKGMRADSEPRISVPIQFEYNSAEISPASLDQLRNVAQAMSDDRLRPFRFLIEGHTDNHGSAGYNLQLSDRRAEAVRRYLSGTLGVTPGRLDSRGFGMSRPLPGVSQDTEEGRALNRRVVFVNLGSGHAAPSGKAEGGKLGVEIKVTYEKGGETRLLSAGGVLTPEDNYRVVFTPSRDSFVYVYQVDAKGTVEPLFPNARYGGATNPVKAKRPYMVPPEGRWLTLDDHPGQEEILVVGSEAQLSDPQAMAMHMREGGAARGVGDLGATVRGPAAEARPSLSDLPPSADVFSYRLPFQHK